MQQSDRELVCTSCNSPFVFTAAEQSFFAERGFQEPRRCKPCRAARKADGGGRQDTGARSPAGNPARRDAGPRGNGNPSQRHGNVGNAGNAARFGERMPRPDDPNGYRAPGFAMASTDPHAIDYAGLPRDEEEDGSGSAPMPARGDNVDRFGMRTTSASSFGGGGGFTRRRGPQGGNDRSGTDPNAYRAPGFAGSAPVDSRPRARQPRQDQPVRARRPMHDVTCANCGVSAQVPFEPTAERPAYCKPCFESRKAERAGTPPVA